MPSGGRRCPNGKRKSAERNRQSVARLNRALPGIFPSAVMSWALGRPFVPPTPRLAIDLYRRAHPIRADRLARALAARSGAPSGWTWQLDDTGKNGLPATYRAPPAPYRERAYVQGPGSAARLVRLHRFGWHVDLWDSGANMKANWHCACVTARQFWNVPNDARLLRRLQGWRCGQSGRRLKSADVDHRRAPVPGLRSEHRGTPWLESLSYWGLPNLQVINRGVHAANAP